MVRIIIYMVMAAVMVACGGGVSRKQAVSAPQPVSYHFRTVTPPAYMTREEQMEYMQEHYWDKFDFADTLFIARADTTDMLRAYAAYVGRFVNPADGAPVRRLMQRAGVSRPMMDYFVMLAERVLHDPNSPLRSDELYIPVLEAQLASPFYDEYERLVPQYDLELAQRNRIGHVASDFHYTTASGRRSSLYATKADYTLLYINNPGCPMCRDIQQAIERSQLLSTMIAERRLVVLAVYPDRDLAEWHKHPLPSAWISGYDEGCVIEQQRLYDLRAIPSLYLLDSVKRVLVKDSTSVEEIEYLLGNTVK